MTTQPWLFVLVDMKTREYTVHLTPDMSLTQPCIGYWAHAHFPATIAGAICLYTYDHNWLTGPSVWMYSSRIIDMILARPDPHVTAYLFTRSSFHVHLLDVVDGMTDYTLHPCRHCGNTDDIRSVLMSIQ